MEYNDFPILNNNEYKIINEHLLQSSHFCRSSLTLNICNNLSYCISLCDSNRIQLNHNIKNVLFQTKQTMQKILENIKETFNIKLTNSQYYNFNLFTLLKKLSNTSTLFCNWIDNEQKTFYKTFAHKNNIEILKCIEKLLEALENSNIYFFKHM